MATNKQNNFATIGDQTRLSCLTGENISLYYREDLGKNNVGRVYRVEFSGVTDIQGIHNIAHFMQNKIKENGYKLKIKKFADSISGENWENSKFIIVNR